MTRLRHLAEQVITCDGVGARPFVALEHLESRTGGFAEGIELPVRQPDDTSMVSFEPGDVLFGKLRPYLAKSWLSDRNGLCSSELIVMRPMRGTDSRWLAYLAQSDLLVEWAVATSEGVKMPRTSWEKLRLLEVPRPSLVSQRQLADYLDAETARIDRVVAVEQARVRKSQERLVSAVETAVLGRGGAEKVVNAPDGPLLPPPGRWEARRNKTFMREVIDMSTTGEEELLTVSHLTGVTPRNEKVVYMFLAESNEGYKRVQPGDLVINTMWAWMGALGVSRHSGIVSPAYGVYRFTSPHANPRYFDALFRTPAYVTEMTRYSTGVWTSRLRLYPESFLGLRSLFPSRNEQDRIADLVEELRQEQERLETLLTHSVDLLLERRQAVITAAVSGELEIPGVAA